MVFASKKEVFQMTGSGVSKYGAASAANLKNTRRRVFRARGSSLVEMLIAIVVLGMVIISMVGMFLISRTAIYNKEDETANALALRYLEELEVKPFSTFATVGEIESHTGVFNTRYDAKAEVLAVDAYSATVEVTVEWDAAALGKKELKLERVISAGGHKNVGELN
jgi:Tfp pilus assembly protein PilV